MGVVCAALCGRAVLSADPSADEELWEAELEACRAVVEGEKVEGGGFPLLQRLLRGAWGRGPEAWW